MWPVQRWIGGTAEHHSLALNMTMTKNQTGTLRRRSAGSRPQIQSFNDLIDRLEGKPPKNGRNWLIDISFIGSHTTIVNAGKDADNEGSNITTAAMGVSDHWSWLIRRARSAWVMVVPCRPDFQATKPHEGRPPCPLGPVHRAFIPIPQVLRRLAGKTRAARLTSSPGLGSDSTSPCTPPLWRGRFAS